MMTALSISNQTCSLIKRSLPELEADEILVKMHYAAICRTDLYVTEGKIITEPGRIIGHEGAGIIQNTGESIDPGLINSKVAIIPLRKCGKCEMCVDSNYHHCINHLYMGIDYDGCFASHVKVKESEIIILPEELRLDKAAYLEPLAATLGVLECIPDKTFSVGVQGKGRISELTLSVLRNSGFLKAEAFLPKSNHDVIIECNNAEDELALAIESLKPNGLLVLKSRSLNPTSFAAMKLLRKRIRIESAYYSSFETALKYLLANQEELSNWIGPFFPISSHKEAFEEAVTSEAKKTFFDLTCAEF